MNSENTNLGGWTSSDMRNIICPQFLNVLPSDLQNVIISCTKYSDNTGGGSNKEYFVSTTTDKIWLLSEFEVHG